jgi:hypothetical protein
VVGTDSHYDWGETSLPYLSIHNADMLEPVLTPFTEKYGPSVHYFSAMVLLNYRLLRASQDVWTFDLFLMGRW